MLEDAVACIAVLRRHILRCIAEEQSRDRNPMVECKYLSCSSAYRCLKSLGLLGISTAREDNHVKLGRCAENPMLGQFSKSLSQPRYLGNERWSQIRWLAESLRIWLLWLFEIPEASCQSTYLWEPLNHYIADTIALQRSSPIDFTNRLTPYFTSTAIHHPSQ